MKQARSVLTSTILITFTSFLTFAYILSTGAAARNSDDRDEAASPPFYLRPASILWAPVGKGCHSPRTLHQEIPINFTFSMFPALAAPLHSPSGLSWIHTPARCRVPQGLPGCFTSSGTLPLARARPIRTPCRRRNSNLSALLSQNCVRCRPTFAKLQRQRGSTWSVPTLCAHRQRLGLLARQGTSLFAAPYSPPTWETRARCSPSSDCKPEFARLPNRGF